MDRQERDRVVRHQKRRKNSKTQVLKTKLTDGMDATIVLPHPMTAKDYELLRKFIDLQEEASRAEDEHNCDPIED